MCFGNNKNVLFLNLNDKIIEQEMNKTGIHTHVIFRPRNAMFFLSNLKIVHFCYFQNTFPFVSTFRQTDDIRKKSQMFSCNKV